ncbi:heparinase II/III domain-containing protein [Paenibacillus sp.]|uniref:heparinase II/III domain-containing protein n=1 Tax=Paenibacillus sp. TaxID=58172 RepID=UPI002D557E2A|nr:heparinase II/III family protein [Paenibacillus sp.]HZG57136.1 heparinase II/III family protein [Paenibacillus sp.]
MNGTELRLVRDWTAVKAKIGTYEWAKDIFDKTKQTTDWWVAHYQDDPTRVAGWMHNYFCAECAVPLVFDPAKPGEHACSQCGKPRRDAIADEAWCAAYRSHSCTQVFHAAVLYRITEDASYLEYIRKVLAFYAEHLPALAVSTPQGFEGKFSGINLSDAVSICWMLNGMELVKETFSEEELTRYKERFFFPMAEFLHRKKGGTPNICCWMKSALGMIGLFFREHDWCRLAADGEEGIRTQLKTGLLAEGFWYESSFHYHFYCAEGLTYYAAFCKLYEYDFPELTDGIRSMYRYPTRFAFPNGRFPSPNDGWPLLGFGNYAHQYEWIQNLYDEPAYRYALSECYDDARIGGLPRLLFGTDWKGELDAFERETGVSPRPERVSHHDPSIHYAMLQNDQASVFLKYGFVIREHSHADVMNFELFWKDEIVSRDISNSGYGSDLFREWQRKSIAHNTVMVDRRNQPHRPPGTILAFDAEHSICSAAAKDVYPGVHYARELRLTPGRLHDTFAVTFDDREEHVVDWLFHCSGELVHTLPMHDSPPPGDEDGYQLMQHVQSCMTDRDWELQWRFPDKSVTLSMRGSPGTEVFIFKGYEHRADLLRWGVLVRRIGRETSFEAEYRLE